MSLIADTATLAALCARLANEPYVCVDTEFMRDSSYWPYLCLVQICGPDAQAAAIDTLAPGLSLEPLFALLRRPSVLKVFHAARQDLEALHHLNGEVPASLFDTQIVAMVCGFGEAASYETLARKLAKAHIDKSSRFTDWSRRPLSDRQLSYALSDVAHMPAIYAALSKRLERTGRGEWLVEEMKVLTDPATYAPSAADAWRRIKTRNTSPRFLAALRELAATRERFAQDRNVPRNRVLRDDALVEIAQRMPETTADLADLRALPKGLGGGGLGAALIDAVRRARASTPADHPLIDLPPPLPAGLGPLVDLLKVLLKMRCEQNEVAVKLVASAADLELIAADDHAPVAALSGWRREIFGADALKLKRGEIALSARGGHIALIEIEPEPVSARSGLTG